MLRDPKDIALHLTKRYRQCILALSEEWQDSGYSKVDADILYALGGSDLHRAFAEIVDCEFHIETNRSPNYRHRLLPLGLQVKAELESLLEKQ